MSRQRLAAAVNRMPTIRLADLDAAAPLLVRRDRKYLVPVSDAGSLMEHLGQSARILSIDRLRSFRYESVLLRHARTCDVPRCPSTTAPVQGSDQGLSRQRPMPARSQDPGRAGSDSEGADRLLIELRTVLNDEAREFVTACRLIGEAAGSLGPVLTTRYLRSTLLLPEGVRVTVDLDFEAQVPDGRMVTLPGMAVVETKSRRVPSAADRWLWELGHRPLRVSKFGTSLAALETWLPANKWTQALRHPWQVTRAMTPAVAG